MLFEPVAGVPVNESVVPFTVYALVAVSYTHLTLPTNREV